MAVSKRFVRLSVADRDGRTADCTFRPSSMSSLENMLSAYISTMVPTIHAISDGIVKKIAAHLDFDDTADGNGGDSLISRKCIIFWRNDDDNLASIVIPALAEAIETEDDIDFAVIPDLSVFDDITEALTTLEAIDSEGVPINGTAIAAALIV